MFYVCVCLKQIKFESNFSNENSINSIGNFRFFIKSKRFTASGLYVNLSFGQHNQTNYDVDDKMMCNGFFFLNIQNFKKFVIGFSSI